MGLRKIIGSTGGRVWLSQDANDRPATDTGAGAEERHLYVNGGGQVLALTPEQVKQRLNFEAANATPTPEAAMGSRPATGRPVRDNPQA